MKLQIVSDLHLGLAPCDLPVVGADLLILAGDIHRPAPAMRWARAQGMPIVYIAGNHEYYGSSLAATDRQLQELSQGSEVTVLDCSEVRFGRLRVLGATLWTDFGLFGEGPPRVQAMDAARSFSRDFSRIQLDEGHPRSFSPADCARLFERHRRWLEGCLADPFDGETVVVTHFAPSVRSVAPRFAGSPLNACFVSDLERLVAASGAALWVHGHTHDSFDYRIGDTRVLANPRGYVRGGVSENLAFDPGLTVVID